ncbi:hypothetical protein SAL_1554 [Streptococcus agalactiae 515]|nr:hypothetical protein SAL_1554 [Streptococcus agalactiae 515]
MPISVFVLPSGLFSSLGEGCDGSVVGGLVDGFVSGSLDELDSFSEEEPVLDWSSSSDLFSSDKVVVTTLVSVFLSLVSA